MRTTLYTVLGAMALFGGARLASAQEAPPNTCPPGTQPVYSEMGPPPIEAPPAKVRQPFSPANMSLTLGGGVANFARERLSSLNTAVAGTWDLRYLYGTRTHFGVEAAYQGTAAGSSATFGTGGVETHALTGNARFNITKARIQPFLTAGLGWGNLRRVQTGPEERLALETSSNSLVVPFGAGLAAYIGNHATIDLRGSYELVTNREFSVLNTPATVVPNGVRPDMWSAQLRAGYAF